MELSEEAKVWIEQEETRIKASELGIAMLEQQIKLGQKSIELDRKQPEGSMTFAHYQKRVINDARVAQGRRLYKKHRVLLDKTALTYH